MKPLVAHAGLEVPFENIFLVAELRENYLKYLKHSYQLEPMMFLLAIRDYKQSPDKKLAQQLIETYIADQSCVLQVNIDGQTKTNLLHEFQQYDSRSNVDLGTIFDAAYKLVYLELRSDSFQRYLNSQMFASFLKKKGDMFFKTISIDTKLEEEITPGDFESPYITDKDIYFLVRLTESASGHWKSLKQTRKREREKEYYSYISKFKFQLDGVCKNQKFSKLTGFLDFSAEQALYALLDKEHTSEWEVFTKLYKPAGYDTNGDYDVVRSYSELEIAFFLQTRYACGLNTVVYDTQRKCYMWIAKTTNGFNHEAYREYKKAVRLVSIACYTVYQLSDNKCRYSIVIGADYDIGSNKTLKKKLFKKRGKTMHLEWKRLCKLRQEKYNGERPIDHNRNLDTLDAFMRKYVPDEDSKKTWYTDSDEPPTPKLARRKTLTEFLGLTELKL